MAFRCDSLAKTELDGSGKCGMDTIIQRQQRRFLFLKYLYDTTGGSTLQYVAEEEIAKALGFADDKSKIRLRSTSRRTANHGRQRASRMLGERRPGESLGRLR